jgi:hypothetical protein
VFTSDKIFNIFYSINLQCKCKKRYVPVQRTGIYLVNIEKPPRKYLLVINHQAWTAKRKIEMTWWLALNEVGEHIYASHLKQLHDRSLICVVWCWAKE